MTASAGPGAIGAVADGLWRRLRDVLLAERRIETFAFVPEAAEAAPHPSRRLAALLADDAQLGALARDVTLRALGAVADGTNYRVLASLDREGQGLDAVARTVGLPALAVSERVHALAQLGLALRDLERDGVAATGAGRGLVGLVDAISGEVAARARAEAAALV